MMGDVARIARARAYEAPLALSPPTRGTRQMANEKIYRNRVYYKLSPLERLMGRVQIDTTSGCWLWTGVLMKNGYGRMEIEESQMYAHRASWFIHNGEIPSGNIVFHHCDVRNCVNPAHLYLGTYQSNMDDAKNRNRMPCGERRRDSKLSLAQVEEMRTLFGHRSDIEIGKIYGVHDATVYNIRKGKRWKR